MGVTARSRFNRPNKAPARVAMLALLGLLGWVVLHKGGGDRPTELIAYAGMYPSRDDKYDLRVEADGEKNIAYRVLDKETGSQCFAGIVGKQGEAWGLCWDGADNLWVCGEADALVYVRVPGSEYKCYSLREKDYSKSMPPVFRRFFKGEGAE